MKSVSVLQSWWRLFLGVLLLLFLTGCGTLEVGVEQTVTAERVAATSTAPPTETASRPVPTGTPVPPTSTPSATPVPPTMTPTQPVATATPPPFTATATQAPAASPTSTALPTPADTATPDGGNGWNGVQTGGRLGQIWSLADLRYHVETDRVRVVWEMQETGDHVPYYEITPVDTGAPAPRIDIVISDLYAYDFPLGEVLPTELPENTHVIRIDRLIIADDARLGFSIVLTAPHSFRVYELTDPVRLVIEVVE